MTGNGIQAEIGTIQLLWEGLSMAAIKSPSTAHQFLLFFGAEDREVLAIVLAAFAYLHTNVDISS